MPASDEMKKAAEQVKKIAAKQGAHLETAEAKVQAAVEWAQPFPDKRGTGLEGHLDEALAHVDAAAYDAHSLAQEEKSRGHARAEEQKSHLRVRAANARRHIEDSVGKKA